MTDYEAKWLNAVEENKWLIEQNQRLQGNKRENPTLRDQFAMAALTGIIPCGFHDMTFAAITAYAYEYADNMMKERDK